VSIHAIIPFIDAFVRERKLSGYSFRVQERWMRQFESFCNESSGNPDSRIEEAIENFCSHNPRESVATKQKRQCLMRQFCVYLNKQGVAAPLPKQPDRYFSYPKRVPYIFTRQELAILFLQIDRWETMPQSRGNRTAIDPLIFRMAYGCGMRIMEILTLRCNDVDYEACTLRIRCGKNGRERCIPMAASLARRCMEYGKSMHNGCGDDKYFFPGRKEGCHASYEAVGSRFKEYLWKSGILRTDKGPVIHDLRHSYCVHRLKDWVLSDADVYNFLPYLSAFLGHADFRGTERYLRLTADLYPEIVRKMEDLYGDIIPVQSVSAYPCEQGGVQDANV
jgi:integrase